MFVIADLEWITNAEMNHSPTQLAAIRVDGNWNVIAKFNSFIRPKDVKYHNWKHIAYTGGNATDFIYAKNAHNVLTDFEDWLNNDDILLWWHDASAKLFRNLVAWILKAPENHTAISINDHVHAFLADKSLSKDNPYKLAEKQGIITLSRLKHNSKNDVRVIRELMAKLHYPQADLLKPIAYSKKRSKPTPRRDNLPYQYDQKTNLIHKRDCELISEINTQGFDTLKNPIKKGFDPCDCCKNEYNTVLRERNMDTVKRSQYNYIYSPNSSVFHKRTCAEMLLAPSIEGTEKYETAVNTGRTPCRLCNPTPEKAYRPLSPKYSTAKSEKEFNPRVSKEAAKAIKRQKIASKEREIMLQAPNLTKNEKNDIFTLTQPRFAFWVGQGYQTFHLHSCPKLHEVSNLKGFGKFRDAISAGYTPCKKCRPTSKHDVIYSIPITNRIRAGENIEDLDVLCRDAGYSHFKEGSFFCIETSVGKWRINIASSPIKLEHINLVDKPDCDTYHEQPRLFLSFLDTFAYIRRHDDNLILRTDEACS